MGKHKRQKATNEPKKRKNLGKGAKPIGVTKAQKSSKPKPHIQTLHSAPTIPFSPSERILLVGEGDLSFARSLVEHHACSDVTATVFELEEELREKYPHVSANIEVLEEHGVKLRYGVDAMKGGGLWKDVRGRCDRVFFNFPHVGGKTKDVNRQVRYNQELLVAFFKNALTALSNTPGSSIIVTLFEGEPYTLWNIRDLARHSGLQVEKSFRFQARAYPGYRHARTLGVIKGRDGEDGGGWKGEERSGRSYIFFRKGEVIAPGNGAGQKRREYSSDDDVEEEEEWVENDLGDEHSDGSEIWDGIQDSDQKSKQDDETDDD